MAGRCMMCVQVVFGFFFGFALPVAMIAMGAIHEYECPRQYLIPVYLIVFGSTYLVLYVFYLLSLKKNVIMLIISSLLGLFTFAWLIAGSVWVFGTYNDYDPVWHTGGDSVTSGPVSLNVTLNVTGGGEIHGGINDRYCHPTLHTFAFAVTILFYVILALQVLLGLCTAEEKE